MRNSFLELVERNGVRYSTKVRSSIKLSCKFSKKKGDKGGCGTHTNCRYSLVLQDPMFARLCESFLSSF